MRPAEASYGFRLAVANAREDGMGKREAKRSVRNRVGTRFKRRKKHGRS